MHLVLSTGKPTVTTDRLDLPSGAASGIFHCEPAAALSSSGATRRIGWHGRDSLKPRVGVLGMGALRPWPRAHLVLSTGKPTVSADRLDPPSCSASGIFHCEPAAASASSGRLVASVGTGEIRSNQDVASLGWVFRGRGRERTSF